MDSPMDALELLLTMDARRAVQLAQMLDSHNRKRQEEEEAIRTDAVEMLHNSLTRRGTTLLCWVPARGIPAWWALWPPS